MEGVWGIAEGGGFCMLMTGKGGKAGEKRLKSCDWKRETGLGSEGFWQQTVKKVRFLCREGKLGF